MFENANVFSSAKEEAVALLTRPPDILSTKTNEKYWPSHFTNYPCSVQLFQTLFHGHRFPDSRFPSPKKWDNQIQQLLCENMFQSRAASVGRAGGEGGVGGAGSVAPRHGWRSGTRQDQNTTCTYTQKMTPTHITTMIPIPLVRSEIIPKKTVSDCGFLSSCDFPLW